MQRFLVGLATLLPVCAADWCSPTALVAGREGKTVYAACATANHIEVLNADGVRSGAIAMAAPTAAMAITPDGARLIAASAAARSRVRIVDVASRREVLSFAAGHTASALAVSPDGARVYVANRFDDDVRAYQINDGREVGRARVVREPAGIALSGGLLFVANALPGGRADVPPVAAEVTVIDAAAMRPTAHIALPNGSTSLRAIGTSPDGRYVAVTHSLSRYLLPTTQIERGWVQTNAVSFVDTQSLRLLATVLLDEVDRGAANPWAVQWSPDGRSLAVSIAGTHEVSLIDFTALTAKWNGTQRDPANDLAFLAGIRRRVALHGNGPRALLFAGNGLLAAGFFSDTIERVDQNAAQPSAVVAARLSTREPDVLRQGERLFNDASISFQGWLSCTSCHSPDARVDGLNWDLLNDGIGNPKNAKSLLLSHRTPPAMSQGIRETAEVAVRSGLRYILFAHRPEAEAAAIDAWLKSLRPLPSPHLENGKLSAAAERGRKLFFSTRTGCGACHPRGLYTDLKSYDVGTRAATDSTATFDTPTLIELWRTAPYLHDGSAATLNDVLTGANKQDRHGKTSTLTAKELDELIAFLLSL